MQGPQNMKSRQIQKGARELQGDRYFPDSRESKELLAIAEMRNGERLAGARHGDPASARRQDRRLRVQGLPRAGPDSIGMAGYSQQNCRLFSAQEEKL